MAHPIFEDDEKEKLRVNIFETVSKHLIEYLNKIELDESLSNITFLALIGKRNNWKECCPLCLEDGSEQLKNVGQVCGCGHTDTAMFRPCGHIMCQPCYVKLRKSVGLPDLKHKQLTLPDGRKFTMAATLEVNNDDQINCPYCKQIAERTFRIEDTKVVGMDLPWTEMMDTLM